MVDSVSYSFAKTFNDEKYEKYSSNYKNPEYVKELPKQKNLKPETAVIEEIKSENEYYDGSKRLNKVSLKVKEKLCGEWTTKPEACSKSSGCGWCSNSKTCIPRDADGPLLPCQVGAFKFQNPPKDWNLFPEDEDVKIIKQKIGPGENDNIVLISSKGKKVVEEEVGAKK